jgi:hypothetical protein
VLATAEMIYSRIEDTLNRALALLERVDEVYQLGGPRVRCPANQCFFDKLLIELDDDAPIVTGAVLVLGDQVDPDDPAVPTVTMTCRCGSGASSSGATAPPRSTLRPPRR